ncbi:MAG TPA: hypothetical protein VGY53_08190 [Isosphaeraceae bacterium]|jgi:hypothetical protein|nr:hypothetical protein [Isosphaeraceae bacterium]
MATDTSLARIPFRVEDEIMIESMARWMRFIGILTIIDGAIMILLGIVFMAGMVFAPVTVVARLGTFGHFIEANQSLLAVFSIATIALSGLTIYAGSVLCQAADSFDRVARTDVADQAFVANGLDHIKLYLQILIVSGVVGLLMAIVTILVITAATVARS